MNTLNLTRRHFLKSTATLTGGLVLAFHLPQPPLPLLATATETLETPLNAWLRIGTDDSVTVLVAHSEMGQGVYTSLPMLVAEELEADWSKIKVEMSPTSSVYKNPLIGQQLTGGSTSIRGRWESLRLAGATAREMLIAAAAAQWQVKASECHADHGKVIHPASQKQLNYGSLAQAAAKLTPPTSVKLKAPADFKIIGKPIKRLDTPAKVDGSAIYGIDVHLPNMLYAAIQQIPIFGGKLEGYDTTTAEPFKVVPVPNGIAVVAKTYWQAKQGLEALHARFISGEKGPEDMASITKRLQQGLTEKGAVAHSSGNLQAALKTAKKTVEAQYSVPFLAHVTMEPMNCTAEVRKDGCDLWVSTQAQEWAQNTAAEITGLPKAKITVHTTYLGGGFGRRVEMDFISQAVLLAKTVGQPVKLIWSREEDLQHDFYRPAMMGKLTAGLDDQGMPVALNIRLAGPSITKRLMPALLKGNLDPFVIEGLNEIAYDIPNQYLDYVMKDTTVPVGFWRSVASTHNAFFLESFMDELAHTSGKDPYHFRRDLLTLQPRYLKVLDTLAEQSHWDKPAPQGHYRGLAIHKSFGSIVGEVAEISLNATGEVTVHQVTCVIDCGIAVNPDTIKAQAEGSIVYGLSSLTEAITLKNGRVEQSNFHDYPVLRMIDMPLIDVHIIPSEDSPGGVGEPATPPIVPAVTNAVFAATGKRIRHLPLKPEMLRK